jgi:DNA-binding GntR family transcriptional regulator
MRNAARQIPVLPPPVFRTIGEPVTRRKQVAEQIRAAILSMRLVPGDRLIERELCEQMSVSRPLVREALSELEAAGLVESIPYKGPIVARMDAATARGIYEIRAELEGLAGRSCAEHATPAERTALRTALRAVENAYRSETAADRLPAKERFYDVLLAASGNPALAPMLRQIHGRITILRATTLAQPGRSKKSFQELRAIVRAIEDRDPDRAAAACRAHVESAAACALRALCGGEVARSSR